MAWRSRSILAALMLVAACADDGPRTGPAASPPAPVTSSAATSAAAVPTTTIVEEPASELHWWNDRVFYEIFVRSFKDSDGDGIGDLPGLTASLDYLNDGDPATTDDLGVTGIWLMPIFASPSYHGYDVTDYRAVDPELGTRTDLEALLDAAHARGISVLIDLVINHTSIEHPWFVASAEGDPVFRDWYRWSPTDPGTAAPSGAPAWHPLRDEYYFGLFWEGMPDLDLTNPAVTAEMHDIARYWLEDVGVDGFRLDAARHLVEDGDVVSDTPGTIAWLEDFNAYIHTVAPDALVLGEVWSSTAEVARYVPDAIDLAFEFELSESGGAAVGAQDAAIFERTLATVLRSYPDLQFATFLTNHDMDRMMSAAGGDERIARLAATWLLTAPGVPFVYYGEEVGLEGVKPDERIRTPMPWSADDERVGFTTGTPWEPVDDGYGDANVADQLDDPSSLLSHYRTLIHDRSASDALRRGDTIIVDSESPLLTAFLRSDGDDHVLAVLNLSPEPVLDPRLDLDAGPLAGFAGVTPVVGPPAWAPEVGPDGGFTAYRPLEAIPPYGFLVLRFTSEPSDPPPTTAPPVSSTTTTTVPASTEDVATVEAFLDSIVAGDLTAALDVIATGAVLIDANGFEVALTNEPLPADAGFDESWDWDGDGDVSVLDIFTAQSAWGSVIVVERDHDCRPVGGSVVCDVTTSDVFGRAAGLAPNRALDTFRVSSGEIVVLRAGDESPSDSESDAWVGQFAEFERWLAGRDPDLYAVVFDRPCCTGTPDALRFTHESIEAQRSLIAEWTSSPASP